MTDETMQTIFRLIEGSPRLERVSGGLFPPVPSFEDRRDALIVNCAYKASVVLPEVSEIVCVSREEVRKGMRIIRRLGRFEELRGFLFQLFGARRDGTYGRVYSCYVRSASISVMNETMTDDEFLLVLIDEGSQRRDVEDYLNEQARTRQPRAE